jgi:nitrite reductase/ring-hydroxylating ferredoxin subunit
MNRKDFIKGACGLCAAGLLSNLLDSCANDHLVVPNDSSASQVSSNNPANSTTNSTSGSNLTNTTPGANITSGVLLTLDLSNPAYSSLNSSGGYYLSSGLIVFNTGNGINALASSCTHSGYPVIYTNGYIYCARHSGYFDINGNATAGPPFRPLQKYIVKINGNILTVS